MLVSFIIPSYNSAHTVRRCLDSIYALSLKPFEFEVIFVDDCSIDNTCDIVAEYQLLHPNITLLKQQKNNRQGAARNRGVSVAKGEYICFVDSDDAVKEGIVTAIRMAKEKQTDMTALHLCDVNERGDISSENEYMNFKREQIFSGIEMQNAYPYWCSGPVAYVYNKDFLSRSDYSFQEGVLYEDSDFVTVHLYYAERMAYSAELGYIAFYREGSTTHSMSYKNLADYMLLGDRMLRFYNRIKNDRRIGIAEEEISKFAEGVLEGACYNVAKSCKQLIKFGEIDDVRLYYERIDSNINRKALCSDKNIRKYYWNAWTSCCMNHERITMAILIFVKPIYRLLKKIHECNIE